MRAITALHGKKVSSTYTRYACGTFLPNSLYLPRLFSKVLSVGRFSKFKSLVPDVLPNGKTRSSKVPKQLWAEGSSILFFQFLSATDGGDFKRIIFLPFTCYIFPLLYHISIILYNLFYRAIYPNKDILWKLFIKLL